MFAWLKCVPTLLIIEIINELLFFFSSSVGPKIVSYVTKVLIQSLQLLLTLSKMDTQSHILMQVSNVFAASPCVWKSTAC